MTLNPNQSVTLQVQFLPTSAGTANGQVMINSNSSTGNTTVINLSGAGTITASPQLSVSAATLSFGSVTVNTAATQTLTLTSTGNSPVTVNSAAISGAGFAIVSGAFPVTLNPNQSATLQVQFVPSTTGSFSGQITISSNSSTGGTTLVTLSGTGAAVQHEVDLSWNAPASSPVPVSGYNVYRSTGGGAFSLISSLSNSALTYVDTAVVSGASYDYVVKSLAYSGEESDPSNQASVMIP
jgi:Abnormal spindle-like microcephaly-assoc'd, ASPM-SPD-2-Hydin